MTTTTATATVARAIGNSFGLTISKIGASIQDELETACSAGELERVKSLLAEWGSINPSSPPPLQSLLNIAARKSHPALVSFLLDKGAIIDTKAAMSAIYPDSPVIFQAYLDSGHFDPNLSLGHPGYPLTLCAASNKFPHVEWLLAHGADPENMAHGIYTALEITSFSSSTEMAGLLIKNGARLEGTNALKRAALRGRLDMITYLLDQGVDIDDIPHRDYIPHADRKAGVGTPLHEAVSNDRVDAVRLLLEKGANRNLKDSLGRTPLQYALERGNQNIIKMLE